MKKLVLLTSVLLLVTPLCAATRSGSSSSGDAPAGMALAVEMVRLKSEHEVRMADLSKRMREAMVALQAAEELNSVSKKYARIAEAEEMLLAIQAEMSEENKRYERELNQCMQQLRRKNPEAKKTETRAEKTAEKPVEKRTEKPAEKPVEDDSWEPDQSELDKREAEFYQAVQQYKQNRAAQEAQEDMEIRNKIIMMHQQAQSQYEQYMNGGYLNSSYPNSYYPNSYYPNSYYPNSYYPNSYYPNSYYPNSYYPNSYYPNSGSY